ncbi:DUF1599 domain-containing protein [Candidatus Pacearchaeota archaeon]|nr:DUF1599 domain-containing protein [Candidatus Pacearchaeota archaeon]
MNNEELNKICKEIEELLKRKNEMYGDENIVKIGKEGIIVRLTEKIERLKHLLEKKINPAEETIEDTWNDIIGYGIIGLMLQRERWK